MKRFRSQAAFGRAGGGAEGEGGNTGEASTEKTVEFAAVALLARREHSVAELKRKLSRRHPQAMVEVVVARLAAKNLVSDSRFVTNFVHYHAPRGQGPLRIRSELRQQGIADEAITEALADSRMTVSGMNWAELAAEVRQRKFGAARPGSLAERAKQARFLQYRGFNGDQIRAALNAAVVETASGNDFSGDDLHEESQDSSGHANAGFDLDLDS